jgi:4-amino-4-deoxy-L-arabinose transferase-like glycosyltransferase
MLLNGDFISPMIYGHYWFDKPIMTYLGIAVCYKLFGINEFAARLPAAVAGAASVAFLYWFYCKLFINRRGALLSAMVLATSLEFWVLSRMIITDMLLFFCNSAALALLYLGLQAEKRSLIVMAYAAAGLAVLVKGPVGIVLPGLIIIFFLVVTRQWRLFGRLFLWQGIAMFFLVAAPWYIVMYQRHGAEFINTFLGLHNYVRATVSEHPQDNVFYYYLVLFPISMLPWSGLMLKALGGLKRQFAHHARFLFIWLAGFLVFYTLMATKYPTYVFPAMFPAALLIGYELNTMLHSLNRRSWWWLTLPSVLLFAVFAAARVFLKETSGMPVLAGAVFGIAAVLWLQIKGNYHRLPMTVAAVTIVISLLLIQSALVPLAEQRSAKTIVQNLPTQGAMVGLYGDYATSAVFYSGYTIPQLKDDATEETTSWSGKYTMPKETVTAYTQRALQHDSAYLLVTDNVRLPESMREQELCLVAVDGRKRLYRLINP